MRKERPLNENELYCGIERLCIAVEDLATQGARRTSPAMVMTYSNRNIHDDVIKWKHFPLHLPFVMVTGHRWIPLTEASDLELWWFLWSAHEQTVEQTIHTPVIWDSVALIMTSL